jgi:hypothetical protein
MLGSQDGHNAWCPLRFCQGPSLAGSRGRSTRQLARGARLVVLAALVSWEFVFCSSVVVLRGSAGLPQSPRPDRPTCSPGPAPPQPAGPFLWGRLSSRSSLRVVNQKMRGFWHCDHAHAGTSGKAPPSAGGAFLSSDELILKPCSGKERWHRGRLPQKRQENPPTCRAATTVLYAVGAGALVSIVAGWSLSVLDSWISPAIVLNA